MIEARDRGRWLRTALVVGLGGVGALPGLCMMLWFGWLSATPAWEHQQASIVGGMTVSAAWVVATLALVVGAVLSARRSARRDDDAPPA